MVVVCMIGLSLLQNSYLRSAMLKCYLLKSVMLYLKCNHADHVVIQSISFPFYNYTCVSHFPGYSF